MRFRLYGIALGVFLALGLVFSFGVDAFASHGDGTGIKAEEVDPNDKGDVSNFLDHIMGYYNKVFVENVSDPQALTREITIYGMNIRQDKEYNYGDVYSLGINSDGILTNHSKYPELLGYELDPGAENSDVANTVGSLMQNSNVYSMDSMNHCEAYGQTGKHACATKVESPTGHVTVIAGLRHYKDDPAFKIPDTCKDFSVTPSAEDVYNDPTDTNLENYVKGVIEVTKTLVSDATREEMEAATPGAQLNRANILRRVNNRIACLNTGDVKHENIYIFIMEENLQRSTVLVNGNNFDLNGANLDLNDGEQNIAELFAQELGDKKHAYVNYHWDDPTDPNDNVQNYFAEGVVPGTSCKRSYIEVANINEKVSTDPTIAANYIFGSGIYVDAAQCAAAMAEAPDDDDDGCAIAGAGHTSQGTLLNLFLIASVLFSVVFLRRRV